MKNTIHTDLSDGATPLRQGIKGYQSFKSIMTIYVEILREQEKEGKPQRW